MKLNKIFFLRLILNVVFFTLPIGLWYGWEAINYGGILSSFPRNVWLSVILAIPLLTQLFGLMISFIDDRFRPFVYGSLIPILYSSGMTLYNLGMSFYYKIYKVTPYMRDTMPVKWIKFKKMGDVIMQFDVITFTVACVGLTLTRLMVVAMWKKVGKKPLMTKEWRLDDDSHTDSIIHGSAEICSQKYLRQMSREDGMPIGGIVESKYYSNPYHPKFLEDVRNKKTKEILRLHPTHTVVVAPTGQGKGVGIVIPTLLDYQGSVVVTDIKGENYAVVANQRRKMGKKVYVVDPFKVTDGKGIIHFNPLDSLDPNDYENLVDDACKIAYAIRPVHISGNDATKFFQDTAACIIWCFILYVVCSPEVPKKEKNLMKVYELLCRDDLENFWVDLIKDQNLAFGSVQRISKSMKSTDFRELSSHLNTARAELRFLESPSVRDALSTTSTSLGEIVQGKADLFICINNLAQHGRVLRLFIGVAFRMMVRARGNRAAEPLLILVDEMPLIGYMWDIEEILLAGRGYGLKLMGIGQSIEAIRQTYPESYTRFITSGLSVFFGIGDVKECEYIERSLGKMTVLAESNSQGQSVSEQADKLTNTTASEQSGTSYSEVGRSLRDASEIRKSGEKMVYAFMSGTDPIILQRLNYLTHPHYKGKFKRNPLHASDKH